jgi:hypothetical protein
VNVKFVSGEGGSIFSKAFTALIWYIT